MGLDMFLHRKDESAENNLGEQVMYLRKVNSVHGWIVDHLADGVDECQLIPVSVKDIRNLVETIEEVLGQIQLRAALINAGSCSRSKNDIVVYDEAGRILPESEWMKEKVVCVLTPMGKEMATITSIRDNGVSYNLLEEGKIVKNSQICEDLLPTRSGFFFGSMDYDNWYVDGLKEALEQLKPLTKEPENAEFIYVASW